MCFFLVGMLQSSFSNINDNLNKKHHFLTVDVVDGGMFSVSFQLELFLTFVLVIVPVWWRKSHLANLEGKI